MLCDCTVQESGMDHCDILATQSLLRPTIGKTEAAELHVQLTWSSGSDALQHCWLHYAAFRLAVLQGSTGTSNTTSPCLMWPIAVQVKSLERSRAEEEVVPSGDVARHLLDAIATARSSAGGSRPGALGLYRAASTVAVRAAAAAAATAGTDGGGDDEEGSRHAMSWCDKRRRRQRQDAN